MIKKEIVVNNDLGLHARPAAVFIQHANKYKSNILKFPSILGGFKRY